MTSQTVGAVLAFATTAAVTGPSLIWIARKWNSNLLLRRRLFSGSPDIPIPAPCQSCQSRPALIPPLSQTALELLYAPQRPERNARASTASSLGAGKLTLESWP